MKSVVIIALLFRFYSAFAFTHNDPAKTAQSDGSDVDTIAALNYVTPLNQDGWVLTVGTNLNLHIAWSNQISIAVTNRFTMVGYHTQELFTNAEGTVHQPANAAFDGPTITNTYSASNFAIIITPVAEKTVTVRDFIWAEWTPVTGHMLIDGWGTNLFRLSQMEWIHSGSANGSTVWVGDLNLHTNPGPYGLIDHWWINSGNGQPGYGFFIHANQGASTNNYAWLQPMSLGGIAQTYIEDGMATSAGGNNGIVAIDGAYGASWTFRWNTLTNTAVGSHGADEDSTTTNSVKQTEWYENYFFLTNGVTYDFLVFIRGGVCYGWSNTVDASSALVYNINQVFKQEYIRAVSGLITSGLIDRHYSAPGPTNGVSDYLGTGQPGMGVKPGAASQDPIYPQYSWVSWPCYYWSNTITANCDAHYGQVNDTSAGFDQLNRDFFKDVPATNYVMFTYPHPLQGSTSAVTTTKTFGNATIGNGTF